MTEPEPDETGGNPLSVGMSSLAAAVGRARRSVPSGSDLRADSVAGLGGAIASVPDGMAASVLAGVNPVYGLYASALAPIAGGLLSSTQLMRVTTTTASALAASTFLLVLPPSIRDESLWLLVVLVGAFALAAGLLRLGRFTAFVSHSVMVGFLSGVAALVILGQLPTITGVAAEGANRIAQSIDVFRQIGSWDVRTLAVAGLALVLIVAISRTRFSQLATLLGLAVPSILVLLLGWTDVEIVNDSGGIPRGFPPFSLPDLRLINLDLATAAAAIAAIALVQGAGVSQSVPNADGNRADANRDFVAQGAANIASGLFRGLPVGGSVSQTAVNLVAGARTRWAAILSGAWMLVFLVLIPNVVAVVAMPTLAAILVLAGIQTIRLNEALSIWETGWESRVAVGATFVTTLFLPIQAAVGIGAVLSAVFYLNQSATDIKIVRVTRLGDGRLSESKPPSRLASREVTALMIYGSLFYAGARTLEDRLPSPQGADHPVVILNFRHRTEFGATLIHVLATYADKVAEAGGRLYLSGATPKMRSLLKRTGKVPIDESVFLFDASPIIGESTGKAMDHAEAWLATLR